MVCFCCWCMTYLTLRAIFVRLTIFFELGTLARFTYLSVRLDRSRSIIVARKKQFNFSAFIGDCAISNAINYIDKMGFQCRHELEADEVIKEYKSLRPNFIRMSDELQRVVHQFAIKDASGKEVEFINARCKPLSSLRDALVHRMTGKYPKLAKVPDCVGLRVITRYDGDRVEAVADGLCEYIRAQFCKTKKPVVLGPVKGDEHGSVTIRGVTKSIEPLPEKIASVFGYRAFRLDLACVLALQKSGSGTSNISSDKGHGQEVLHKFRVEIQVRSLLMHAWMTTSQQIYRMCDVPEGLHRSVAKLCSSFELCGDESLRLEDAIAAAQEPSLSIEQKIEQALKSLYPDIFALVKRTHGGHVKSTDDSIHTGLDFSAFAKYIINAFTAGHKGMSCLQVILGGLKSKNKS